MSSKQQILIRPLLTEKTMTYAAQGRYTFEVHFKANKSEIIHAVERQFSVNVIKIQTIILKGKGKKAGAKRLTISKKPWKKAVVQLAKEQKIDLFEISTN